MKNKYKMIDWTDDKIKKYWDFLSQYPDQYFTYQVGGEFVKRMSKYIVNATNILDYGAGPGHLIPYLLKTNSYIYALEFSDESAKKMFNQYNTAKGFKGVFTYEELVNKQMRFDVIIIVEVIEHLNMNPLPVLQEINRILKPDGILYITTPNQVNLFNRVTIILGGSNRSGINTYALEAALIRTSGDDELSITFT